SPSICCILWGHDDHKGHRTTRHYWFRQSWTPIHCLPDLYLNKALSAFNQDVHTLNSFSLFQFAKKLPFFTRFLPFFPSVAMLCNSKKSSTGQKMSNFRFNSKSLNEFLILDTKVYKKSQ